RLETELGDVLFRLTARRFADRGSWETWWRKNRDTHQLPELATVTINDGSKPASGQGQTVTYFDIRLVSKHASFLVDVSGSMAEKIGTDRKRSRLDEAKSQLTRVVAAMPEDCACNLIVYSTIAKGVWDRLRPAKPQHKQELQKWVD